MPDDIVWAETNSTFGSFWPHGSCTAVVGNSVCGWPRRADGTCVGGGHPAPPDWKDPTKEQD